MPDQNWQFELEEYIKQGEPDQAEKSEAWQTAIGLQADMGQTGGSRTGYHPFLLDICCVNGPTITPCELGFRKYAAKFE